MMNRVRFVQERVRVLNNEQSEQTSTDSRTKNIIIRIILAQLLESTVL